jgi:hypothetical protein
VPRDREYKSVQKEKCNMRRQGGVRVTGGEREGFYNIARGREGMARAERSSRRGP